MSDDLQIIERLRIREQFRLVEIAHEATDYSLRKAALKILENYWNPLVVITPQVVPSSRPIDWNDLKRDLDQMARNVLQADNPEDMNFAIKNVEFMMKELKGLLP